MRIKIIKVPSGEAPLNVRENWVGLVLSAQEYWGESFGISTLTKTECTIGYSIDIDHALSVLTKKSPDSANWFRRSLDVWAATNFVFGKDEAEVVEP